MAGNFYSYFYHSKHAAMGECENGEYVSWMYENCKQSCGLCGAGCKDKYQSMVKDAKRCAAWATDGECTKVDGIYRDWMALNCKKSCQPC